MVRIRLNDLDDAVKEFLAPAQEGETIVVEDDNGQVQCGVTSYVKASSLEKQAALAVLSRLQQKSAQAMAQAGVTEADIDRELQD
jgi:alpha-D-ribose 1-methylphosphonate 5-triphosphate synthase subunit PhnI